MTNQKAIGRYSTNLLTGIAMGMKAAETEDMIRDNGEKIDEAIAKVRSEMEERGNDVLRVVDLTDIGTLANDAMYDGNVAAILQTAQGVRDNIKSLEALGITVPDTYKELSLLSFKANMLGYQSVLQFLRNFLHFIENPETAEDTLVDDIMLAAGVDLMRRQLPPSRMFEEKGLEIPEGKSEQELEALAQESYESWLAEEFYVMMEALLLNPMRTYILKPLKVDLVKETLQKYASSEDDEYINSLTPIELFGGEAFQELQKRGIIREESKAEIISAVSAFMDANAITKVPMENGQERPILNTLNLGEIVAHAFIMHSAVMWDENIKAEELPEDTKYMVDLIELVCASTLPAGTPISDVTPMKVLSVFSSVIQLIVSQNPIIRTTNQQFMSLSGAVITAMGEIMEEKVNETKEGTEDVVQ